MNRILIALFSIVLLATSASSQQHRLDSLLGALKIQKAPNKERMMTLIHAARASATIRPAKGIEQAHEAWRIANRFGDDTGRSRAWNAERWCLQYLTRYIEMDSVGDLAEHAARRSGDRLVLAEAMIGRYLPGDRTQIDWYSDSIIAKASARIDSCYRIFREAGDLHGLAEAYATFGLWSLVGDVSKIDSALILYERLHDTVGMALCLNYRYFREEYAGPAQKLADQQRSLELALACGNRFVVENAHVGLLWCMADAGRYDEAVAHGIAALAECEALGDPPAMRSVIHYDLGDVYRDMNDWKAAKEHYRKGAITEEPDCRLGSLNGLAEVFLRLGQSDSALHSLMTASRENIWSGNNPRGVETRGLLAEAYLMKGDTLRGIAFYDSAYFGAQELPDSYMSRVKYALGAGRAYMSASTSLLRVLSLDRASANARALDLLDHSLKEAKEHGLNREEVKVLLALSELYERSGDLAKALNLLRQHTALKDSVLNADKAKAVANLQIQYETEKKEQQIVLLGKDKEVQAKEIQKQKLVRNGFMGGFALVALFAGVFFFQRNRISKEKARSEELLLNILPEEVAEELKAKGEADARQIDQVTVLFTDFKGFTAMSEQLTAKELVADIHECFSAFDHIMAKHGIEKIKTIGDAYMAAGGLPTPNNTHAIDVVKAALEIADFIAEGKARKLALGQPYFEIRIGIHTGPVVAGIVGVKKFAYDIWGDTVNTASRMESSGEVGQVNISEATYALVKDETGLTFTPRGKVQAKGKGELEMYFVRTT